MNPVRYTGEAASGQPGGSTVIQYTTVNVSSEPPKDHIIWSLFSFVYSNPFCLGLAALIFSIKARDRKVAGDLEGARHYSSTARCLNIWATVLTSIMVLITFVSIIALAVQANAATASYSNSYSYNYRG